MRIIGGKYKGRRINVPSTFRARPTTDFAREGLFNILANAWDFEELAVLDLFAGTGSVGFEFASRGAGRVDMVELDPGSVRHLERTVLKLAADNIHVHRSDALKFIRHPFLLYDIAFADPPYDLELIPELPDRILNAGILAEGGWLILEHGRKHSFNSHPRHRELRKYGSVHFSIFI